MQTMANHKSYFTEISNSYRGLAAQIKQGRNRRRPWRNLMGCYQEKLERTLGGEEHMGQDADCKVLQQPSTGQLREARAAQRGQDSPDAHPGVPVGCVVA